VVSIGGAVIVSEVIALAYIAISRPFGDFSRSFFMIDALICAAAIVVSRLAERVVIGGIGTFRDRTGRRTIIVGAGRTGRSLLRELRETPGERVVGLVDDNPGLRRRRISGASVIGASHEIERLIERHRPDIVLVTIPDAPPERLDLIVQAAQRHNIPCRFVRREVDLDPRVVLGAGSE
jgi:FlaA1/EpsC-like NDP-sugar epimerase